MRKGFQRSLRWERTWSRCDSSPAFPEDEGEDEGEEGAGAGAKGAPLYLYRAPLVPSFWQRLCEANGACRVVFFFCIRARARVCLSRDRSERRR